MTAIPPLESEDQALRLPEVAAIYAAAGETGMRGAIAAGNMAMLSGAIAGAGVKAGAYDARILLIWLPQWEPQVCAVFARAIRAAYEAGRAAREDGGDG